MKDQVPNVKDHIYVDSPEALDEAYRQWAACSCLGVDLECENNLHYYGTYISIIQVSSEQHNWVVDVLRLQQIEPVLSMLEDPQIQKIFHDASFDLMILYHQFRCRPKNIFDTQIASHFLGKMSVGLDALLQEYFKVAKDGRFQMIDWTRRPLTHAMLEYAVGDTLYLIKLRDILAEELKKKSRLHWVMEEFAVVEEKGLVYEERTFMDFPGSAFFTDRQRSVLKHLFDLRRKMAKEANKPPYFVISTKRLTELVRNPPKSTEDWKNIGGVHPVVKRNARLFYDAVQEGLKGEIKRPPLKRVHYTPKQAERLKMLSELREDAAKKLQVPKHLLLSKEQMQDIAVTGTLKSLRKWQKEVFSGI